MRTEHHIYKIRSFPVADTPLAKKPAQKQIYEQPRTGGAPSSGGLWDKHLIVSVLSAVWMVPRSRHFV
ncbi:hypothetical protein J6590_025109 [Homalodisca vitripennis]|nr:hypothetical protein J6590_025109 [Homalodisca vitripennis]